MPIRRFFMRVISTVFQVVDGVGDGLDRARQGGAAGIGVTAALEFLRDLQRLALAAAQAGNDHPVCAAEEG